MVPSRHADESAQRPWYRETLPLACGSGVAGGALVFIGLRLRRRFRRIETAGSLPLDFFKSRPWVKGRVTSVGDADGFRLYHTPFPSFLRGPHKDQKLTSRQTISIRLAGVDAPEMPHFGHKGQPFAFEAQEHLKKMVEGKIVRVQLLRRDRYERCVGAAYYRSYIFWWRSVAQELAKRGPVVYDNSDAVYGDRDPKEKLVKLVQRAQAKKLGMWSIKAADRESPGEYKRRTSG